MVKRFSKLDATFGALAHPARRDIVAALAQRGRVMSELAQPFAMSLPGFLKHLRVLEHAGLVSLDKQGRTVHCSLNSTAMRDAAQWLARYETFWEKRLDALGRYLEKENASWQAPRRTRPSPSSASSKRRRSQSGAR